MNGENRDHFELIWQLFGCLFWVTHKFHSIQQAGYLTTFSFRPKKIDRNLWPEVKFWMGNEAQNILRKACPNASEWLVFQWTHGPIDKHPNWSNFRLESWPTSPRSMTSDNCPRLKTVTKKIAQIWENSFRKLAPLTLANYRLFDPS